MLESAIITLCIGVALMVLVIVFAVVSTIKRRRSYSFRVHGHEIVLSCGVSLSLYVDGMLEDRFEGNLRMATLRAQIDGEQFKAMVKLRTFGVDVTASYAGLPVEGTLM